MVEASWPLTDVISHCLSGRPREIFLAAVDHYWLGDVDLLDGRVSRSSERLARS